VESIRHCWIVVLVPSAQGQKQWAIELESPSGLARKGLCAEVH
jgi:hypothetical protein